MIPVHHAWRGSAWHEGPVLPSRDVNRTQLRAGLLTTSTSVEASMSPLSLPHNLPSLSILFDLYLYSEGTQASTLSRVSSWSPSRSCSFRCVSSSPSTLTPTASLESTFNRLPLGCLLFM